MLKQTLPLLLDAQLRGRYGQPNPYIIYIDMVKIYIESYRRILQPVE